MKKVTTSRNNDTLIPPFSLPSTRGGDRVGPADFKQQSNLILFFFDSWASNHSRRLLRSLHRQADYYRSMDAQIITIAQTPLDQLMEAALELGPDLLLLSDVDGSVRRAYANEPVDPSAPFMVIADRFGAFFASLELEGDENFDQGEIRSILAFIETMCPECGNFRGDTLL